MNWQYRVPFNVKCLVKLAVFSRHYHLSFSFAPCTYNLGLATSLSYLADLELQCFIEAPSTTVQRSSADSTTQETPTV